VGCRTIGCGSRVTLRVPARNIRKEQPVLDLILLAVGLGFFALSIAYAYACERL
jgi:hypothetical protein